MQARIQGKHRGKATGTYMLNAHIKKKKTQNVYLLRKKKEEKNRIYIW